MIELLLILTTGVVLVSMAIAYAQARDALHPLMFLGPMLLYVFVVRPGLLIAGGELQRFVSDDQLIFAQLLFTLGIAALCAGILLGGRGARGRVRFSASPGVRRRMVNLACFLGSLSLASYWYAIIVSGGFLDVYSQSKAYISAGSGWINELVNLSIPSAALLLLAWGGARKRLHYLGAALLFASPLLMHGLLGARRGPTFIIMATMLLAWYITSKKRVSIIKILTGVGALGLIAFFLVSNRGQIHLGSEFEFKWDRFYESVVPKEVSESDDTVFLYGFVNGVREYDQHYWGARYAVTYFVRPIPRQLWPTKYRDLGFSWLVNQQDFGGITDREWKEVLGWVPVRGSAAGFAADLYQEFGWLGLIGCYVLGWFYGWLWKKATRNGGLWTLLYVEAMALSVYVPTQSVSAVFHRFLFTSVPTAMIWRMHIGKSSSDRSVTSVYRMNAFGQRGLVSSITDSGDRH